ncbi:PREDICTED: U-box domain-containing protein 5-like [Camelina sativa]|uniref:RING-type E3 ubiquitin transferase n=1 Tax=Camelina sativa TaxID=90675 RepID=A0ABM0UV26_CAMSA|nr:PREDICTED: U-box domain-containing protein 5-like [Camelina sativa]
MAIDYTDRMHHSYKIHSSMCIELKNVVDRIMRIVPLIEDARPGCSSGIQTLCLLHKALAKARLLLQYCRESSKLYMAVTGDAILARGSSAKKSLEQCLNDIQSMVPTVLSIKITQIVQNLRSTVLTLESSEEEAGKAIRELMQRSTTSSVSSDESNNGFCFAAIRLQLTTPEAIAIERRSLKSLLAKLKEGEVDKRQILKFLLYLLKKHERNICEENSFSHHQFINASLHANAAEPEYSEEHSATTFPEQFKCPLSLTVMYDPVIISSGHTFERMRIQKWFDEGNVSCPVSKRRLDDFTMEPNVAIKNQISKWCARNGLDVQDPAMKDTKASSHNIDFSVSIASFGSSLCNIPDLGGLSITDLNSICSIDSPSYSKMLKGGYFTPMQRINSASGESVTDSSSHSEIEIDPLCGLTNLPWDAQIKVIEDVKSRFEHSTRAFRSMSPSKFLEPLITYLKNALERYGTAGDILKGGLDLLLAFLNGNRKAIEALEEEVFKMFSVFLESEVVAEEALNILEVVSSHQQGLSKITSSGSLSSLLKIAESQAEHLQEQAMITLKNLSSSSEICLEMVSLDFIQKLTSFLQRNIFCKHSIIILRNLCNTEKGRVCITETPDCLASIADLLESNVPEEQENAISILLQLCVQKIEYCDLVVKQATDIYSSLLLISNNGTDEAKVGASELLRALEEVGSDREEEEEESSRPEEETTASTSSQVVTSVTRQEPIITTIPAPKRCGPPKKSSFFGFNFSSLKKKKC